MTKMYEGDYEYEEAWINFDTASLVKSLKTEEYIKVVRTFCDSIEHIDAFHYFPLSLIGHMQMLAISHAAAVCHAGHDPADMNYQLTPKDYAYAKHAFERLKNQLEKKHVSVDNFCFHHGSQTLKDVLRMQTELGRYTVPTVGVEAVLAAMITAGYSALEAMAEDLWIAAANRHPAVSQNWADRNRDKNLTVTEFAGRDLTHCMGTLLTQKKRIAFYSFNDIKKIYSDSFRGQVEAVFCDCAGVRNAEKVRHLIAHRAGVIDEKFKDEMTEFPEYGALNVDERIPLNGPVVKQHLRACIDLGAALIQFVDRWSQTAPTS